MRKALEPLGVTHAQFIVLAATDRLSESESCVTQAEICRFADIDENMTSQVIRNLEEQGLLARGHHPSDSRAWAVALTEAGEHTLGTARAAIRPLARELIESLGHGAEGLAVTLAELKASADEIRERLGSS